MDKVHIDYPKKLSTLGWDTLNIEYPVRKFPETGVSSETIARDWRMIPESLMESKKNRDYINVGNANFHDFNIDKELMRPQTAIDFAYKISETNRFNKHTACLENDYIYPPSRRLADRPPAMRAHGTTEMRSSFTTPVLYPRLVTDKDQFKSGVTLEPFPEEPGFRKELEPMETTYEGFEKYLDPYLTTSRLHHRPFTADQQSKCSASKDIITFYTLANTPWVRTPKPPVKHVHFVKRPKSMYDKEKFKEEFREARVHNSNKWVPGSFRTEAKDNYIPPHSQPECQLRNYEDGVKTMYQRSIAQLPTNFLWEDLSILQKYTTENSHIGSGKPLSCALDQHVEKNKRLKR